MLVTNIFCPFLRCLQLNVHTLVSTAQSSEQQITIEATVVTGFEDVVLGECLEIFGKKTLICKASGRVFFNIELGNVEKLKDLRGVDNILLIIASFENVGFSNEGIEENSTIDQNKKVLQNNDKKLKDIGTIQNKALQINWKKYMSIWRQVTNYNGVLYPSTEQFEKYNVILRQKKNTRHEVKNIESKSAEESGIISTDINVTSNKEEKLQQNEITGENLLKFRVTCNRVGKHTVSSAESARAFGGKLNDTYLWLVDLDDYDIDISLQIKYNEAYVGLSVTQKSLHMRNIVEFNITTLKATIAYNMVNMLLLKFNQVIII